MEKSHTGAVAERVHSCACMAGLGPAGDAEKHEHCTSNHPGKEGELAGSPQKDMQPPCGVPPVPSLPLVPSWAGSSSALEEAGGEELRGPGDTARTRWTCRAGPASPGGYGVGRSTYQLWDGPGGHEGSQPGLQRGGVPMPGAGHCVSVSAPGPAAAPTLSSHCDFSVWFSDEDFLISQQADSLLS